MNSTEIVDTLRDASADELVQWLEVRGFGWSLSNTERLIEARVWEWPTAIGKYLPSKTESLADMMRAAMRTMTVEQLSRPPRR